jgi:hypothetical protein
VEALVFSEVTRKHLGHAWAAKANAAEIPVDYALAPFDRAAREAFIAEVATTTRISARVADLKGGRITGSTVIRPEVLMTANSPQRPDEPARWTVAIWPDDSARYQPVAACATRAVAVAEAAQHLGASARHRAPRAATLLQHLQEISSPTDRFRPIDLNDLDAAPTPSASPTRISRWLPPIAPVPATNTQEIF